MGRERVHRPIRDRGPQTEPGTSAGRAPTSTPEGIAVNEYEIICKGTVIIGSLRSVRS